jgi:glyoxylase-like metal-dependent hydrolase (beta-lactamase superfamily II)
MTTLAAGLDYVDLNFLGRSQIIATAIIQGSSGVALVDPGPSTTLDNLRAALKAKGIAIADVRHLLLTHIHLDHAGSTGSLVKENPAIDVFVHERGAPHMIDPSKLLASASRLYGDDMERLWGDFLAVPAARVKAVKGGERIAAGGRELDVAYTPGHAWHPSAIRRASAAAPVPTSCRRPRRPTSSSMPGAPARTASWRGIPTRCS